MILGEETSKSGPPKSEQAAAPAMVGEAVPPPAYELPQSLAPPGIPSSNFISITRRLSESKGVYVLDPTLRLPQSILRPRYSKAHLSISAVLGEASAEVYIVNSESMPHGSRTRIEVSSAVGSTKLVLHAPDRRAPMSVSVSAHLGESTLLLPRSFRGPIRLSTTLGENTLSPALRAATVPVGNRLFVGTWNDNELNSKEWTGDEATVVSTLGSVYVAYDDEVEKRDKC
ncbi:hypothetical protein R3P38DRAFT_3001705 [Favolaschia claudopus]|uniref:DUF7330 domain-containing protein n=1 Tax=Favolaschia claudopus TaxID=2862362 RepID=A0AAW0ALU8_9AGAR